ncbi:hypothetical protein PIB30_033175 [Stylosanthes scabra]|uniref:Uncharacterized protein n=1 Tax=Stylosanthes scabra TaxID=79078 RepID=A0ABU6ZBV7_9FABA|nr:hypothetical protein [Stylosanthes scabra]
MDQPHPLVIRLHPNAVAHERPDEVWFQADSPVGRIPVGLPVAATPVRIAEPPLRKPKRRWVIQSQKRMIPTMLRALRHPLTRRKVVRAVRRPLQLTVPVMSFRPRRQSQGWRTCHAISSSSNRMKARIRIR